MNAQANPNNPQTLQQRRAASAWRAVNAFYNAEYGSLVLGAPAMIHTDGLGQTLAFLLAKAKDDHHETLARQLSKWVLDQILGENANHDRPEALLDWLLTTGSAEYRRATNEALDYLVWLKRFAQAKG